MRLFKHKSSGIFYRLVKERKSNVNTYLEVDELNKPTIKKREWKQHSTSQIAIIIGFKNLIEL